MSNLIGLYYGKHPVLEIRRGQVPIWKSPGWTTPNTSIGLATTVNLKNPTGDIVKTWGDGFAQMKLNSNIWVAYDDHFNPIQDINFLGGSASVISSGDENHGIFTVSTANISGYQTIIFKSSDLLTTYHGSGYFYVEQTIVMDNGTIFLKMNGSGPYANILVKITPNDGAGATAAQVMANVFAISSYANNLYVYQSNTYTASTFYKLDSTGKTLSQSSIPVKNVYSTTAISAFTHGSSYDAAGNIFSLGKQGQWYVTKVSTSGTITDLAVDLNVYMQLYTDKVGNVYVFDAPSGTTDAFGNDNVRVTKLSNDLEKQWQKTLGKGLISGSNVMVTDSGLIYVQRATAANKAGRVLDIYQQTNI